jgi:superfamily II DNA or RNA helicase
MTSINLRPHQVEAIEALRDSLRAGNKRVVLSAPTGMGKTIMAVYLAQQAIAKNPSVKVAFFCDRLKLLSQTTAAFDDAEIPYSVLQGDDPRYNPDCNVQLVSTATAIRRKHFTYDIAIIDECHQMYKGLLEQLRRYDNIVFIGLTATPYSRGMAAEGLWQDLVVTTTPRKLMEEGWLAPTDYYISRTADFEGVKIKASSTGNADYDPEELGKRMEEDDTLAGDIVANYVKHSEGLTRRAVCFAPNISYSKNLVERFNETLGQEIAVHIDGYDDQATRALKYQDFQDGVYKVMINSRLLNTGWDDPSCSILIDAFRTRSLTTWLQRIGRIFRIHPDKPRATVLDHAGNLSYFNRFPEDYVPDELHSGSRGFDERKQAKKEKAEPILHSCKQCGGTFTGLRCRCGYELPINTPILKDDGTELVKAEKLSPAETRRKTLTKDQKQEWYSSLLYYGHQHSYKKGWAYHKFHEAFSCYPNGLKQVARTPNPEVVSWITSRQIAWSKRA